MNQVDRPEDGRMRAEAPFPEALARVVERLTFKPGWRFGLQHRTRTDEDALALELAIIVTGPNSYADQNAARVGMTPEEWPAINVLHAFLVPAATYDERAWMRWVFDRCIDVETHEAGEFFKVDGQRPFAPNHGPGRNPYSILERGTEEDALALSGGGTNQNRV